MMLFSNSAINPRRCSAAGPHRTLAKAASNRPNQGCFDGIPLPNAAGIYYPFLPINNFHLYGPAESSAGFIMSKVRTPNQQTTLQQFHSLRPPTRMLPDQEVTLALFDGTRVCAGEIVVYGSTLDEREPLESDRVLVGSLHDVEGDDSFWETKPVPLLTAGTVAGLLPAPQDQAATEDSVLGESLAEVRCLLNQRSLAATLLRQQRYVHPPRLLVETEGMSWNVHTLSALHCTIWDRCSCTPCARRATIHCL